jgi:hypothetical protein
MSNAPLINKLNHFFFFLIKVKSYFQIKINCTNKIISEEKIPSTTKFLLRIADYGVNHF